MGYKSLFKLSDTLTENEIVYYIIKNPEVCLYLEDEKYKPIILDYIKNNIKNYQSKLIDTSHKIEKMIRDNIQAFINNKEWNVREVNANLYNTILIHYQRKIILKNLERIFPQFKLEINYIKIYDDFYIINDILSWKK